MTKVFITYSGEDIVSVPFKDDDVTLVLINLDYLDSYSFLYRGEEVSIDSVHDDGTLTLIEENEFGDTRRVYNVPMEELDVIEGEEYLDV
jgi:hypothetical protein